MTDIIAPPLSRRSLLHVTGLSALFIALRPMALLAQDASPQRIVAVGGAVTETLYALGAEGRIVGIDTTSLYPPSALKDKPNVGYMRQLSAEGVLSLSPDSVLVSAGSGPPAALKLLEEAGVRLVTIPDTPTAAGIIEKIHAIGRATGSEAAAARLASDVETRFAAVAKARETVTKPVKALFVLAMQNGRPLIAGTGTAADGMIALAGATNVGAGFSGYKAMTDEAIITAAPDVVVMMAREGLHADPDTVFANAALSATPAGAARRLVTADGHWLLGFGPRTPEAVAYLMQAFYPDLPAVKALSASEHLPAAAGR
ncbi:heme/hemin ABC transporter substrate-binding protein [Chelatococcus asaccharovorans]|uniref:Iron complex transport system substrate-binding protein n=1 Tax=Chelatococcus asaccharovorans TaxID=28210 RepID=A0A2V3U469_9HYPH|nr:ABC transporter substrate-binding protein [Chelatococcus asaccharovorans]MBS7702739.1 ABC transporter substrate-binding protein [Chelatococcus asaccharovorans]PXW57032.1 iron complex transport system substrate-binding protein [Chelatococcus asaccharovorans]